MANKIVQPAAKVVETSPYHPLWSNLEISKNYPMTQAIIYRNTINDQCRAQDVQVFRQRHFYQWVFTDRFGYCMSHEGWPFFGFLRQQSEIICLACTDDGAFYESRMKIASIEQALTRRLPPKALNDGEHVLMSLLDLAVNPDFFLSLPHKPVCPGLQLWEDDYTIILVAQLASPMTHMDFAVIMGMTIFYGAVHQAFAH